MALDKDWKDWPDTTTPITAAALEDLEGRAKAYVDAEVPQELAYAELTSAQSTTVSAVASATAITGLQVNPVIPSRPVNLVFFAPEVYNTAGNGVGVIIRDTTSGGTTIVAEGNHWSSGASEFDTLTIIRRINPAAGTRQYTAYFYCVGAGMATLDKLYGPIAASFQVLKV